MKAVTASFDEIFEYTSELTDSSKIARDKDGVQLCEIYPCGDLYTLVYTPVLKKVKKATTVTEQGKRALKIGMNVYRTYRKGVETIVLECDRTAAIVYESTSILSIQRKISQIKKQRLHDRVNKILNLHSIA